MKFAIFIIGVVVGLLGQAYIFSHYTMTSLREERKVHSDMIDACKKNQPRPITCILKAVPVTSDKVWPNNFENKVKRTE